MLTPPPEPSLVLAVATAVARTDSPVGPWTDAPADARTDVTADATTDALPAPALALIGGMLDAVWLVDGASIRITGANEAAGVMLGMACADLLNRDALDFAASPEERCFWSDVQAGLSDAIDSETLVRRPDGGTVPVMRRVRRVEIAPGRCEYLVVLHDRSAQRRAEAELENRVAELAATLESTADGILVTDLSGQIRSFNEKFACLWDIPPELLARRDDAAVLDWMLCAATDPLAYAQRLAAIDGATMLQSSDVITLKGGRVIERVTLPQCSRGVPIGRVYSFRDITAQLEATRRIDTLSHTDSLTGLANRRLLADRVEFALAAAKRDGGAFALLFANLDRFKHINDTLGQTYGDTVLIEVGGRLKGCLRQMDTVARLGGDEFVLLVHHADVTGAEAAARRVLESMQKPFTLAGMSFTVTCSLGIALYPTDGVTLDDLMRRADASMHEVKGMGRAGYRFHKPKTGADDARRRARLAIDHAMRQALKAKLFRLHYQPQVCLQTGRVLGAEALIRWRDPELGDVSPGEFIPVAEESGFIVAIGDWVLREAVRQAAVWHAAGRSLLVSINVSSLQFQQPGFVGGVSDALRQAGLPPQRLELELTESILIQDAQEAMARLQALARLGVKLAIDDFGTGYSSLAYLKRFPINRLKIDRSFVKGLPNDPSDVGIVNAIIHMGRALQLQIVAEGVETEAQQQFLKQAGCEQLQGFVFAPALPVPEFELRVDREGHDKLTLAGHPASDPLPTA